MDRAISHLFPDRLSDDDRGAIEDCLDAAMEWDQGRMSLNAAATIATVDRSGQPSRSYARCLAITTTPRTDPRWPALWALCSRIAEAGAIPTRQGLFTRDDLRQHDRAIEWIRLHPNAKAA